MCAQPPAPSGFVTPEEEKRYAQLQTMALDFARQGDTETLASMVQAGLPVNLADHKGNSLLMLAAYHGHAPTVARLLALGAEVDRPNDRGQTPLGGVAFKGYPEVARTLLAAGADPNADHGGGCTPLLLAELFGRSDTAAVLRAHGAGSGRWGWLGFLLRPLGKALARCRRPQPNPQYRGMDGSI